MRIHFTVTVKKLQTTNEWNSIEEKAARYTLQDSIHCNGEDNTFPSRTNKEITQLWSQ